MSELLVVASAREQGEKTKGSNCEVVRDRAGSISTCLSLREVLGEWRYVLFGSHASLAAAQIYHGFCCSIEENAGRGRSMQCNAVHSPDLTSLTTPTRSMAHLLTHQDTRAPSPWISWTRHPLGEHAHAPSSPIHSTANNLGPVS